MQNVLNYCPCCAADLQPIPETDLNYCHKCGTNLEAVRVAMGFTGKPAKPKAKPVRITAVSELRAEGHTIADIARKLHLAKSTVSDAIKTGDLPALKRKVKKKKTWTHLTIELKNRIRELSHSMNTEEVARELRISPTSVKRVLKRGVEPAPVNHAEPAPV